MQKTHQPKNHKGVFTPFTQPAFSFGKAAPEGEVDGSPLPFERCFPFGDDDEEIDED